MWQNYGERRIDSPGVKKARERDRAKPAKAPPVKRPSPPPKKGK